MKVILNNWAAKILALALAVILWALIKRSLEPTTLPSRFQFEMEKRFHAADKFQFDSTHHGNPTKK